MRVPLLDVTRVTPALQSLIEERALEVLRGGEFINGPGLDAFEDACARALGVRHAIGVSNGSDAILMVLMALGVGPGDEVIVPSYTFFATAGAVSRLGATPVFVDSLSDTLNIDPAAVARAITSKTRAIIPVHLFGLAADLDGIGSVASGLPIIEDCAQSFLAPVTGARSGMTGSVGVAGTFSFFPSKNLGGFGDGGMICTSDDRLAEQLRVLRMHGSKPKYHHAVIGGNFRLDTLQAVLLNAKLPHVGEELAGRRRHAQRYADAFAGRPNLRLPPDVDNHTYNQFVVRLASRAERDAAQKSLTESGIGTAVYYPVPLHRQACFAGGASRDMGCPVADEAASTSLALPVFAALSDAEQEYVITRLEVFLDACTGGRQAVLGEPSAIPG